MELLSISFHKHIRQYVSSGLMSEAAEN